MTNIIAKIKDLINKLTVKLGDKKMRILCSFIITLCFGFLGIVFGVFMGCLSSFAKGVYDHLKYLLYEEGNGFNKEDLVYNVIGIAIAAVLLFII